MNGYIDIDLNFILILNYMNTYTIILLWYNTKRLHASLGYISPLEMEMKLKGITKKVA